MNVYIVSAFVFGIFAGVIITLLCDLTYDDRKSKVDISEDRFYIKGDAGENIPLPYSWTLSDALNLRDLLVNRYMVGCKLLYGNDQEVNEI